jgi:RNA polymerase sigma-70 factor (ECF subfamily)
MALRSAGKHQTVSLDVNVENDAFVHPDRDEAHEQQLKLMEDCMKKLPDDQAACLRLFYLEQKCYKEVAEYTGYDMNKVKSYIQNGKRNLKICMEKNGRE